MNGIEDIAQKIISFRDARARERFHNPKDVAISLSHEAAELPSPLPLKYRECRKL